MTTRLDAASARARLTLATAITLCALTLLTLAFAGSAQAAAPDFTWSSSLSTTQAGGHPNMTFNYASSSTQSLTRLDVDLPQGLMHRNNLSGACSNPLYISDRCPASSTVGTVSAQVVVARVSITVPGTIYQLTEPSGDSDATFGLVLRPPLSGLGLTGKILIRNQISFTNGGGLRSSLVGPLSSITVLGATLPARIAQLKLVYNSQTPTGNIALISNPTGCKLQTFSALGTFSDGATRSRTSSYTTTGCPAVPFAPKAGVQIQNNTAGQRTAFSASLQIGGSGSSAALHFGHVVAIGHDFDQLGDFDFEQIDKGVLCTDAQAASAAGCPAASEIGDLSADVEGFGAVTGKTYATNSPGHKTISEITLRRVKVRFPGGLGGDNDSTLSFTGLPQLPLTSIRFQATRPILKLTNTCAIRLSRMTARSFGDGHAVDQVTIPAPDCTPAAPTITDGPDRGITINTTHVEYRFSSGDSGVTFECKMDDAAFAACGSPFVDDWQAEKAHVFSVRAVRGGIAGPAATATFTVDTAPPVVDFTDYRDDDSDDDGYADAIFRDENFSVEFSAGDATSGLAEDKLECSVSSSTDPTAPAMRGKVRPSYAAGRFICEFVAAPPGPGLISLTAYDVSGHVTVLKLGVIILSGQPTIVVNEKRTFFTDAPDAEVPIEITDDSLRYPQGEVTVECYRKGWDGTIKGAAKIITDRDSGRSKGFCVFPDVPEGSFKVVVRGWNPVKKESIAEGDLVVDRTPPEIKFTNPEDADSDNDGVADKRFRPSFFDVFTEIVDLGSGVDPEGTSCLAKVKNKGVVKGNIEITKANRVICSVGDLPDGDVDVEITARNYVGTVTIVKRGFTVDTAPPVVDFTDYRDDDSDDDGNADAIFRDQNFQTEFSASDATSGLAAEKLECSVGDRSGTVKSYAPGKFICEIDGALAGPALISLTAYDVSGHVTVLKLGVIILSGQPTITVNEKRTFFTDAPDAEVPIEITDDSLRYPQGEVTVECYRKGWDGTIKGAAKIITDRDSGRSKGFCVFPDVPEGSFKVEVRGWNPVKKESVAEGDLVVDRTPPEIKLTNPEDADSDNDGVADKRFRPSFFDVFTEIADLGSGVDPEGTSCLAKVVNKGAIKGAINVSSGNRVVCTVEGLPDGDVDVEITARNYVGTVTIVKRGFTVDTMPPDASFTDPGDLDLDGDGFSDNRVRAARIGFEILVDDKGIGVDPNSGACLAKPRKGGVITGNIIINNGNLRCSFEGLPDGDTDIEISVADYRGHVTVLKAAVTIESP